MDNERKNFYAYIIKEEKEFVCSNCGTYSMEAKNIEFLNDYEAKAKMKCKNCDEVRETNFTYFDE